MAAIGHLARVAIVALAVAACGSSQPSAPPSPVPSVVAPSASPSPAQPTASASGTPEPTQPPVASTDVTAFYYLWYGTAAHDGAWRHWNQLAHKPPDDLAATFYPVRGPYSSRDPAVLASQMQELRSARVGVIAVSWWGKGGWEDQTLDALFAAANAAGIRIAFHLEPYQGQTAASIAADIHYLLGRFGTSPALFKTSRATSGSASPDPRPVFYLFGSSKLLPADLKAAIQGLRGTPDDSIIMVHSPKAVSATRVGADGVYTYDAMASPDSFAVLAADCTAKEIICSPSVAAGFDNRQAVATGQIVVDRQNGARYDSMWQAAVAAHPTWVSVTSFNEWHESTQIEPATDFQGGSRTYTGYEGAYGTSAADAPNAYLTRTAYWVGQFAPSN
jgi:glycoprotein endo-alpha-1,2-mannosidase